MAAIVPLTKTLSAAPSSEMVPISTRKKSSPWMDLGYVLKGYVPSRSPQAASRANRLCRDRSRDMAGTAREPAAARTRPESALVVLRKCPRPAPVLGSRSTNGRRPRLAEL
jgi:hypothetical protein